MTDLYVGEYPIDMTPQEARDEIARLRADAPTTPINQGEAEILREALKKIAEAAEKGWQGSGGLGRIARQALTATAQGARE